MALSRSHGPWRQSTSFLKMTTAEGNVARKRRRRIEPNNFMQELAHDGSHEV